MGTSQRVSRGFHRLGLVLAAIPLVAGSLWTTAEVLTFVSGSKRWHEKQVVWACARERLATPLSSHDDGEVIDLHKLGCSQPGERAVFWEVRDARHPGDFSYSSHLFTWGLALALGTTLAASLAVYGIVRAIGWVIGGFATS